MTDDNAIDSGGVYAYMAPDVTPVQPQPLPIPSVPLTFAISAVDIMEAIRGLGLRIDALVKRCDDLDRVYQQDLKTLDRHFDQRCDALSVRLDALEAAREPTEPEDCVVIDRNGVVANVGVYTLKLAQHCVKVLQTQDPDDGPYAIMRLVPVEPPK